MVKEERKIIRKKKKGKEPFSFEIWIFRNGPPDRDDDHKTFVVTTSTQERRSLVWVAFVSAAAVLGINPRKCMSCEM